MKKILCILCLAAFAIMAVGARPLQLPAPQSNVWFVNAWCGFDEDGVRKQYYIQGARNADSSDDYDLSVGYAPSISCEVVTSMTTVGSDYLASGQVGNPHVTNGTFMDDGDNMLIIYCVGDWSSYTINIAPTAGINAANRISWPTNLIQSGNTAAVMCQFNFFQGKSGDYTWKLYVWDNSNTRHFVGSVGLGDARNANYLYKGMFTIFGTFDASWLESNGNAAFTIVAVDSLGNEEEVLNWTQAQD